MKITLKFPSKTLTLIICSLFFVACNPEERKGFVDPPESPVGEYKLLRIEKSWMIDDESHIEYVHNGCDRLSTIKFKSNNTIEFVNYNYDNDEDCSDFETVSGSWIKTGSTSGGFYGDFSIDGTFSGDTIYNGNYDDGNHNGPNGIGMIIVFNTVVEGVTIYYSVHFQNI